MPVAEYNIGFKPKSGTKVGFQKMFVNGSGTPATGSQILADLHSIQIAGAGNTATRAVVSNPNAVPTAGDGWRCTVKLVTANNKTVTVVVEHFDPSKNANDLGLALVGKAQTKDGDATTACVETNISKVKYV